jgi:hypothetical protein
VRLIIGLIVAIVVVAVVAPVVYYGTTDPCRMLAKDMASDAYGQLAELTGSDPGEVPESVERTMRLVTSQMTSRSCAEKLWDSWTGADA